MAGWDVLQHIPEVRQIYEDHGANRCFDFTLRDLVGDYGRTLLQLPQGDKRMAMIVTLEQMERNSHAEHPDKEVREQQFKLWMQTIQKDNLVPLYNGLMENLIQEQRICDQLMAVHETAAILLPQSRPVVPALPLPRGFDNPLDAMAARERQQQEMVALPSSAFRQPPRSDSPPVAAAARGISTRALDRLVRPYGNVESPMARMSSASPPPRISTEMAPWAPAAAAMHSPRRTTSPCSWTVVLDNDLGPWPSSVAATAAGAPVQRQ